MLATLKLLFYYQFKSWISVITCLGLPLILMIIVISFANTIQQPNSSNGPFLALPGIIIAIGPIIGILNLTLVLTDFKQSLFFKRLKAMPLKMIDFLYGVIIYQLLIIFTVTIMTMTVAISIYYQQINFAWINWPILSTVLIFNGILSCCTGFLINQYINDFKINLIVAITYFLLTLFLGGCFLPLYVIKNSIILKIMSLLIPTTYLTCLVIYSWYFFTPHYHGHELVSFKDYNLFNNYQIPMIIVVVMTILLLIIIILKEKIKFLRFKIINNKLDIQ
ncbi:hypothetical protein [Spiroplasma sp. AdecLV25b]|uniref:hypothetical protein n=1 Tax=Spiroplasma sp. AdecLV25b TaxID=3027162 RepID=UPI0027E12EFD|nr:hypothetical protein [Spiroplasma sp. AdecLV25b]